MSVQDLIDKVQLTAELEWGRGRNAWDGLATHLSYAGIMTNDAGFTATPTILYGIELTQDINRSYLSFYLEFDEPGFFKDGVANYVPRAGDWIRLSSQWAPVFGPQTDFQVAAPEWTYDSGNPMSIQLVPRGLTELGADITAPVGSSAVALGQDYVAALRAAPILERKLTGLNPANAVGIVTALLDQGTDLGDRWSLIGAGPQDAGRKMSVATRLKLLYGLNNYCDGKLQQSYDDIDGLLGLEP